MKKSYAILIVALLMLPMLTVAAPVRASTGHPQLGAWDGVSTLSLAALNVTIQAGDSFVSKIDGVAADWGDFVIAFNATGHLVDFSGAVFDVYISQDGYSALSANDIKYASGFSVADLDLAVLKQVNITNAALKDGEASFYIGTVASTQVLIGPIPFDITADYKYIKIFDGSTFVAVAGIIEILPAFTLTPDSGAPCTTVTLNGVALEPNTLYNITYGNLEDNAFITQITSGADGKLNFTWQIIDRNSTDYIGDVDVIGVHVIDNSTGIQQGHEDNNAAAIFFEDQSYFTGLSVDGDVVATDFLNATGPYDVYVFSDIQLNGSYWCVSCGHVTITVDGIALGTATLNSDGNFTADFTIPILSLGDHTVKVTDCSKTWVFNITVLPTLIATPDHGPIGTTVTLSAYGFPANINVYLYWEDDSFCVNADQEEFWIANATTGSDGQFNVTVTTVVVTQPGGSHDIDAFSVFYNTTQMQAGVDDEEDFEIAEGSFLVTPTVWFTPSTIDTNGSVFNMLGNGLDPEVGYSVNIDNQAFATGYEDYYGAHVVFSDDCGTLNITLVAAGFTPGLHVGALYWDAYYWNDGTQGNYEPAAYATFTVTGVNDPIYQTVGQINTTVTNLNAQIVSIQGNIATLNTSVGTIQGVVTSIKGDTATILTNLGTVSAKVDTIKGFLPVDLTPVWIAVILSLIAAIASIYGIIVIRSKIAA